jgi:hypothetical protein
MTCNKSVARVLMIPVAGAVLAARAEERKTPPPNIPKGAKVFIAPIGDGFETYLKEAIAKKQVPVEVVASRDQADYEITGVADSQKASSAKKVILGNWHSREEASVTVSTMTSSEVVWAYSVHQEASTHGKRSSAEACAKHLKDAIEK